MSKLRQLSGPQSLHETPLVPIEITVRQINKAGDTVETIEKHNLRFNQRAVGRLEAELSTPDKPVGILDIWEFLAGGRFSVRLILAVVAAGIAHEYKRGQEPDWEEVAEHFDTLDDVRPLIQPAMAALLPALSRAKAAGEPAPDPNPKAPAAE